MRIFLTGATGYVGSAVLDALRRGGHTVTALVRDPEKAERMRLIGVQPIVGDLSMPKYYVAAVEACDSIIHTALEPMRRGPGPRSAGHRLAAGCCSSSCGQGPASELRLYLWYVGSGKHQPARRARMLRCVPRRMSGGCPIMRSSSSTPDAGELLRTAIVRPGIVYGGARGIIGDMLKNAANGLLRVVGDGRNRWACVYDRDLADLYVRVATLPDACGIYHANDEADERVSDIVEALARYAKVQPEVRHVPIDEARAKMGPYADALALNQIVRSPRAKELGWTPALHSVAGNVPRLLEEFRTARMAA